jgi:hypothetical protein
VVAGLALVLALAGTGTIEGKWFQGFASLGRDVGDVVSRLERTIGGAVRTAPVKPVAGPVCVLVAARGSILGLDQDGCIATSDTTSSRSDLPVLTGFLPDAKGVGEVLSLGEVVVGMAVLRAFEARPEMLKALSEINLGDLGNPKAILCGGVVVDLGSGHYKRKVQELNGVLAELKRLNEQPKAIDLRFARQAVVRCSEPDSNIEKEV